MTPTKEDCLKLLYQHGADGVLVSNKTLAEGLGVTPASVTEIVLKLKQEGYIEYQAYKGSRLTEEGRRVGLRLVRNHRLWEVFLIEHLGYSWSEAHEDAHIMEHMAPQRMIDRLNDFLGRPTSCPHGAPIPQEGHRDMTESQITLASRHIGDEVEIERVNEEKELLDYLEALGITIGATVRVAQIAAYDGPITVSLGEQSLQISRRAADQIFVH